MDERKRFLEDWRAGGGENVAALCRVYAISRKTGYKWLERFRAGGMAALTDRSHAAERQSRRIAEEIEGRRIAARRRHPSWGPKKLRAWLERREPQTPWPAASTIGEALKRAGLVNEHRRKRHLCAEPSPLREAACANELWTIDYKGQFRTTDGEWCYPLTVVDAHSRYLLDCAAHGGTTYQQARGSLERLFQQRGLPRRIRSDNGTPFASTGAGRLSRLNVWWLKLGIVPERIEPGKPQQNGRHERLPSHAESGDGASAGSGPAAATETLRPLPPRVQPRSAAVKGGVKIDQCGAGKLDQLGVERQRRNRAAEGRGGVFFWGFCGAAGT